MTRPDWWADAEPEIHAAVAGFAEWVNAKVATVQPYKLIAKNPFLFRARAPDDAAQFADRLIDAFLSSSEETHFGEILEAIAVSVCTAAKGGRKSSSEGVDLEYDEGGLRTVAQVKSGVNWGNSSQRKRLVDEFNAAKVRLRQGGIEARCIEGCCYGPSGTKDFGSHVRLVGNAFWFDVSGWSGTGKAVLKVIAHYASDGLAEARETARERMVAYLRTAGCASKGGRIKWGKVYDVVMAPTRERPR